MNFDLKREICNDHGKVIWNNNPLFLIPNQHLKTININSDGFRGNELQDNPDYRIFVIGGSTTFGVGVTDSNTFPSILQQKLSAKFPYHNIEVVNAGIPGAYSFPEANLIKNKILAYDPDLLIIYDGWNDLDRNFEHYFETSSDIKLSDRIIRLVKQSDYVTPQVILELYFNYKHEVIDMVPFNSSHIEQKILLWSDTWNDICNLQRTHNFKTIVALQPILGTGNKQLSAEEQKNFLHYDSKSQTQYYQLYADALPKLQTSCTSTYDLRHIFDAYDESIFFDSGHVGNLGNEIIANVIHERIENIIESDLLD